MKITKQSREEGFIRLVPENLEDLWHLERVLSIGDKVEGVSFRTFKASEAATAEKKKIHLTLYAEKIEFARSSNKLRVTGKILSGTPEEFVQVGSYHTIDVEPNFPITIYKDWKQHHLDRLKQAISETKRPRLFILVLDEQQAQFASVRGFGVSYDWDLESHGSKRDTAKKQVESEKGYFGELLSRLSLLPDGKIIVAGPGFTKDNFAKFAKEKSSALSSRFVMESCTYAERSGVNELMKKGVVQRVASDERVAQEMQEMEKFKEKIAKGSDKVCYGLKAVKQAVEITAAEKVLVLDELLRTRKDVEQIIELADKNRIPIMIFSHESDGGGELAGLGGLAAFLRFGLPPS